MAAATPLIPFEPQPTPAEVAGDHSLLELDRELDFLLEQIEDEIDKQGEASTEAMDRLALYAKAMNMKVDRIGRYLSQMETRAAHCKREAERYAERYKRAERKIGRTKSMVLYYLESHDMRQLESDSFTLRRQKNSQDSVIVSNAEAIPEDLRKFELRMDGPLLQRVKEALPDALKVDLAATVKSSEPSNTAIRRYVANGGTVEGAQVKRLYNLRVA
jgi:Siphovirus Gp157